MNKNLIKIGKNSKLTLQNRLNTKLKNKVLYDYLKLLQKNKYKIILENKKDIAYSKKIGLKENLIKRLTLDQNKIESIIKSVKTIIKLKDPINITLDEWKRPNGLKIKKVSGNFIKGDHIRILDKNLKEFARGLSSFTSDEISKIKGHHSNKISNFLGYICKSEVIHKDDMVLL